LAVKPRGGLVEEEEQFRLSSELDSYCEALALFDVQA
jgi:hypothetical protein